MPTTGPFADNTNEPLWKRLTLRLIKDETLLEQLSKAEHTALWEKAVNTMKPDPQEHTLLMNDEAAQKQYMLRFVRAYAGGMPPLSGLTERRFLPSSE